MVYLMLNNNLIFNLSMLYTASLTSFSLFIFLSIRKSNLYPSTFWIISNPAAESAIAKNACLTASFKSGSKLGITEIVSLGIKVVSVTNKTSVLIFG